MAGISLALPSQPIVKIRGWKLLLERDRKEGRRGGESLLNLLDIVLTLSLRLKWDILYSLSINNSSLLIYLGSAAV